jgi:hypothetical protein
MNESAPGIWPPHEAFYLEAMLFSTTAAIKSAGEVNEALRRGAESESRSPEWQDCALTILDGVQVIALQAGALSRFFWPPRDREPHTPRAARLREGLRVLDGSPLQNRDLRNHLEHLDERIDEFCSTLVAGVILPMYVGPTPAVPEVPTFLFRAYYTDVGVFEVFGHRYEMEPILAEIESLDERLRDCTKRGSRIPYSGGA